MSEEVANTNVEVINEVKTIRIKPVNKAGFFGIAAFAKAIATLGCELSTKGHNTGLTQSDEAYFEDKLKLPKGELAPHSKWWDEVFNVYHTLRLPKSKTFELILDSPMNELRYKVALACTKIANSEIERNTPGVLFYIDDIEAKAKKDLEMFNFEFEGMKLIIKCSPEEKRGNLRLFGKKGTELMSEDMLNAQLAQEMKKDPKNFFNVMTDKDIRTKALIKELEEKYLIKRTGNKYYHGEDLIAISTDECVEYFNDLSNQPVRLILESKLKKAKKAI